MRAVHAYVHNLALTALHGRNVADMALLLYS